MLGIIVSGHGNFASGITSGLNLIMGKQTDYHVIDFNESDSLDHLNQKFDYALKALDHCSDIIILCDLFSGTPFNIAMKKALSNDKVKLFYGLNLGVLIELVSMRLMDKTVDTISTRVLELGKSQFGLFNASELNYDVNASNDDEL